MKERKRWNRLWKIVESSSSEFTDDWTELMMLNHVVSISSFLFFFCSFIIQMRPSVCEHKWWWIMVATCVRACNIRVICIVPPIRCPFVRCMALTHYLLTQTKRRRRRDTTATAQQQKMNWIFPTNTIQFFSCCLLYFSKATQFWVFVGQKWMILHAQRTVVLTENRIH